jgi:tyrosyl-tRNA synthetase
LNVSDEDANKWIKIFTFLSKEEIEDVVSAHSKDPGQRILQKKLAGELTNFVHGKTELEKAIETTNKLFAGQTASADTLSINDLETMEGIVKFDFPLQKINENIDVVSFLAESSIFPSKGEARKMVLGGGVSINRNKVSDISAKLDSSFLLHEKYILVQKGRRNYYLVKAI